MNLPDFKPIFIFTAYVLSNADHFISPELRMAYVAGRRYGTTTS